MPGQRLGVRDLKGRPHLPSVPFLLARGMDGHWSPGQHRWHGKALAAEPGPSSPWLWVWTPEAPPLTGRLVSFPVVPVLRRPHDLYLPTWSSHLCHQSSSRRQAALSHSSCPVQVWPQVGRTSPTARRFCRARGWSPGARSAIRGSRAPGSHLSWCHKLGTAWSGN